MDTYPDTLKDRVSASSEPDTLIVTGLGPRLDGSYPCNMMGMILENTPHTLTNREGHRVKVMSGVRAGELMEAIQAGDNDVLLALAAIVLTRAGKTFDESMLWDAPMGSGLSFDIAEADKDDKDDDDDDDENPTAPPTSPQSDDDGGATSSPVMLAHPANDPSGTGTQDSSPSDPATLAS